MRRHTFRWLAVAVVALVFGALMCLWRQGAEWLVRSGHGALAFPIIILIIAGGWYAERKGWLT